jgi:hypothetical protein
MGRTLTIRCNGPEPHENEVNIDALFTPCFVVREDNPDDALPRRRVLDCKECSSGKVIVTREMVKEKLG